MLELTGKTVLVTGGSRGIGAAIVRAVATAGADVVLHYNRSRAAAEALAADIGVDRCHLVAAAFESDSDVTRLWEQAVAWKGRIDVLISNAAVHEWVPFDGDFQDWTALWHRTMQINLYAAAHLCRAAVLHFRERGGGIVIAVTSNAAHRGSWPDSVQYAASKAGIKNLAQSIARGFAADNVLAYVLAPGLTRTELSEHYYEAHASALGDLDRNLPLGEWAPPEDVARMAAFLATGAVRHAPGTTIDVNGASYVR